MLYEGEKEKIMKIFKEIRFIVALLLVVAITHFSTKQVMAYSILFGTKNFATNQYQLRYYYDQAGTKNYSTNVSNGIAAWNSSTARVYVYKETDKYADYNINITSKDYGNTGWSGHCQAPIPIVYPDNSYIKINEYYDSVGNKDELVSHELGHSFRLDDVSNTAVLMRNSGYKGSAKPEQDDINGVNSNY